jgi:hypothetical protein
MNLHNASCEIIAASFDLFAIFINSTKVLGNSHTQRLSNNVTATITNKGIFINFIFLVYYLLIFHEYFQVVPACGTHVSYRWSPVGGVGDQRPTRINHFPILIIKTEKKIIEAMRKILLNDKSIIFRAINLPPYFNDFQLLLILIIAKTIKKTNTIVTKIILVKKSSKINFIIENSKKNFQYT